MTEREGRDVIDVVVLEFQFEETARQIHWDRGELVVGQVQGFKGPEKKHRRILNLSQIPTRRRPSNENST